MRFKKKRIFCIGNFIKFCSLNSDIYSNNLAKIIIKENIKEEWIQYNNGTIKKAYSD